LFYTIGNDCCVKVHTIDDESSIETISSIEIPYAPNDVCLV